MTDNSTFDNDGTDTSNSDDSANSAAKDPKDWTTGDEPATPAQKSYIETMATQAGEDVDIASLTKADASETIDKLQDETKQDS